MTTRDLRGALKAGDSIEEIVMFLQYSEAIVRAKAKELGLPIPRRARVPAKEPTEERGNQKADRVEAKPLAPGDDLRKIAAPVREKPEAKRQLMEATIVKLCRGRFLTLQQLADLLGRNEQTLRNDYIEDMVSDGRLRLRFPHNLKSPQQGYGA